MSASGDVWPPWCDLLGAGQVVVYGGGLDGDAALHHQPGPPLPLTGVLVWVVTTPSEQTSNITFSTFSVNYKSDHIDWSQQRIYIKLIELASSQLFNSCFARVLVSCSDLYLCNLSDVHKGSLWYVTNLGFCTKYNVCIVNIEEEFVVEMEKKYIFLKKKNIFKMNCMGKW